MENLRFRQTLYRNDYDARSNLDSGSGSDSPGCGDEVALHSQAEKTRILANWDPSYPTEQVCWYDEYIQRYGPVTVNWLQQPTVQEGSVMHHVEARGVALYYPDGPSHSELGQETVLAVSPLDDGSVCLWDVNGTRGRKKRGAILGRSEPGILFIDGPESDNTRRSKRVDSGVTECVSVDSYRHCAFFAIQSRRCLS